MGHTEHIKRDNRITNNGSGGNGKLVRMYRADGETMVGVEAERYGGGNAENIVPNTPSAINTSTTASSNIASSSPKPIKSSRPLGRPPGAKNKALPDHRIIKHGLLQLFQKSRGPAVLLGMLNFKLPPGCLELFKDRELTRKEELYLFNLALNNFKWAIGVCVKLFPKEIGVFGKMSHEHTLTGMVKRATTFKKSPKVLELVKRKTEEGITEYRMPEGVEREEEE